MSAHRVQLRAAIAPLAGAVLMLRFWPHPRRLQQELTHPHAWIAAVGADHAVATLAGALLWLAALWLCLGTSAAVLSLIPGRFGQAADLLARHTLPSALRRVVVAAAGASILLAPVSAFAAPGSTATPGSTTAPGSTAALASGGGSTSAADTAPAPAWPTDHLATSGPAPVWPTDKAVPGSALRRKRTASAPDAAATVRPGDSLWLIAGHQLGASATPEQIATLWPRWYAANRTTIGADANLITPGMRLHAPPAIPSPPEE